MIQINYLKDNDLLRYSDSVQKKKKKIEMLIDNI